MNENQATPLNAVGNMKHSPLPWHVSTNGATRESGGEPAFPGVHDASGKPHGEDIVCQCLGFSEECRANAELIVASVNRLPAYVAAVDEALAAWDGWRGASSSKSCNLVTFADVMSALRALREQMK